jgi:hypothetical protein
MKAEPPLKGKPVDLTPEEVAQIVKQRRERAAGSTADK